MDKYPPYIKIVPDSTRLKPCFELYPRGERNRIRMPYGYFNVDVATFEALKKFVIKRNNKILFSTEQEKSERSYEIIYQEGEVTLEYYLDSRKKSIRFFKKLLPLCNSNDWLYEEISYYVKYPY